MIFCLAAIIQISQPPAFAQNAVSGSINGTVTDSTGAVVANASVVVRNESTNATLNLTSNAQGHFVAPFLQPDKYDVSATAPGLQSTTTTVAVLVGQQSPLKITVTPTANTQTVQVSANNAQLIDTQTSNTTTTFTTQQFQNLPAPGGDITSIAYTVPGVVVQAGTNSFGSFTSNGLPSTSNLLIINGADDNDPFLNVNNSGSSNLTLGQQEIEQAAVVQNGYAVQYGRQAGAIETFTTKSGANRVHGLLQYNYNSSGLNANGFFNDLNGVPKPKAVSNQYAAQIGGPIKHNKLFFFVNTEGLRYILPASGFVNFPSTQLQASILANPSITAGSKSVYSTLFNSMMASSGYASAVSPGGLIAASSNFGCGAPGTGSLVGTPNFGPGGGSFGPTTGGGTGVPCLGQSFVNAENLNREYLATGRLDWNVSDKHVVFFRVTLDRGQQPTFTSLINPLFETLSNQPTTSGQLNDTYSFTPNLTNQLIASGIYYSAIFEPASIPASLAASPTEFIELSNGGNSNATGIGQGGLLGVPWTTFPQGRNVTQYQIVDDLSWLKGNHNFKFGVDFKRANVTDTILQISADGGFSVFGSLADFAGGSFPGASSSSFTQAFPALGNIYSAIYNIGIYAQDEWRVRPNVIVDYGVRFDRTGNPACVNNCYSHYVGGFPDTSATLNTPYNATLSAGHRSAFPSIEPVVFQPRVGFNWDTKGDGKTVVRGGVGLFADGFPGGILENQYNSFPNTYEPAIFSGAVGFGPGSAHDTAAASAAAVLTGFSQGATFNSINAALAPLGITFAPPNYGTTPQEYHSARYIEYSMQLQRQIDAEDAVIFSYAGNHGYDLAILNQHLNQFVNPAFAGGTFGSPAASPDPRFGTVFTDTNNALSNYNGFSVQYKHIDSRGLTADVSYTWSHAMDDISNGAGIGPIVGTAFTAFSIPGQITPNSVSDLNYSSSDYDIRNNLVADLTYVEPYHFANKIENAVAAGWTIGGKAYWRTGAPFSVLNSNVSNVLNNGSGGEVAPTALADVLNNNFNHTCNSYSNPCFQTPGIFNGAAFTANPLNTPTVTLPPVVIGPGPFGQTNYGNVPRNSFRLPHYADVDVTVYKDLFKKGTTVFQVGAQAYNVLNKVNFGLPGNNASAGNIAQGGNLGVIASTISAATSPYGSGQASAVSGRVLVVEGVLTF